MASNMPQDGYRLITWDGFVDRWRHAGRTYQLGCLLILVGIIAAIVSGVLLASGGGWWILIGGGIAISLAVVGNYLRVRAARQYLGLD
jgi:hypothetical protein